MTDYARPLAQWADSVDVFVDMTPAAWSWVYDPLTEEYTLQTGRPSTRAAFVPSAGDPSIFEMVPQVNGQAEALLMQVGETVHMYTS